VDLRRALALSLLAAAGCATATATSTSTASATAIPNPTPTATSTPPWPLPRPFTPTAAQLAAVERLLATLTLEEKVAQLVIAYPPGGEGAVDQGGVILMGKMLRDPAALRERVAALQRRARVPLLVTADLEGGDLNRFRAVPTLAAFPSAREMGGEGGWEAEAWGRRAGLDLAALGVHVSLGPVLDLADRGFMADTGRSLGADPVQVARLARAFARGLASAGVLPVGKHYPGYGPVEGSSDKALLVVDRDPQEIARHQAAFVAAADVLAGVMMANVGFDAYGAVPAILSPELVARAHLSGFVTVTDDLSVPNLQAVTGGDAAELWRRAFLAGNDLLLSTTPLGWPGTPDPRRILSELVRDRPELLPRLDESVRRVLLLKARAGLLK
jgi:beta-N-acetylhexosaminidase